MKTRAGGTSLRAAALAVLLAAAGSAGAVTLQQAYDAAIRHDPSFRMRFYEHEAGKENRILGRAQLLPQVGGSFSYGKNVADQESVDQFGRPRISHPRYTSRSAVVQLRQPLFNMEAIARYRQGKVQTEQAEQAYEAGIDEVSVRVVSTYLDVLFAQDQLALARVQRDAFLESQKVNQRLFEKGEGTKTDMLETQARLELAEAQLIESQDNLTAARNTLEGVIGMDPGELDRLGNDFRPAELTPASFEDWRKLALERNNLLAASRLAVENARLDISRNRAGHYPRVDFVGVYSKNDSESLTNLNQENTNRQLGLQVNIPIYQGGAINATTRQAAASYGRAQAELDVRTNDVLLELRQAHSLVTSSARKIDALSKAVESGKLLMTATEKSIKGGVRINLDLLNAQQQLFTSQRDLAQARYVYLVGLLRLRAAAGTLTSDSVREIAAYFR
ncbi:TolC family outer membrane protein [Massilia sp. H6]|uniref:TolC family outer membrane protein n=1 Tax=Massilia sp. H6 TaxID=2970464 RepID=UPI002169A0D8|nr:TolC family outer membrane protein [Massilia sp. H6]UVW28132.1 TolC family outer membrane protein [Massilia sp. H6]